MNTSRENYLPTAESQYYLNTNGTNKGGGFSQNFNGEASYDIDSLNLISASFWGYMGNNSSDGLSKTEILNSAKVQTSYFEMKNSGQYSYGTMSGNIDYQKTYKKPDKTFTISYKLDNNPHSQDYVSETQNTVNYDTYKQNSVGESFTREQTLQADYYDPLSKKHQIECGLKGIYRQNYSNSDYFLLNSENEMVLDPAKSNELDYNQTIVGLYGGYVYKLDKFSMKSGLRAELTWNNAVSKSATDTSFSNTLQNIVPYITFTYKLKPTQTIKLSYTQRLQRPSIWYLNPYRNEQNRLFVYYGNPNLKSEVAHSFEIGYNSFTPKFNFGLTGTTSFTNNSIEQIQFIDANNVQNMTFDNIGEDTQIGLNTYISYRPSGKFNIGFNGGGNYSRLEALSMNRILKNDGFNFRGSLNARITLWKDGAVSLNGGYYSSSIQLQGKSSAYTYSSIALSQYFLKKKLMLNLSLNNPLTKETIYKNSSSSVDFSYTSEYIRQSRSLRLNLTYNFGKMDISVKKAKRGIQNDDMKGGGGSGQ
jgi:outer membrane receptor protein involved in Fe transport